MTAVTPKVAGEPREYNAEGEGDGRAKVQAGRHTPADGIERVAYQHIVLRFDAHSSSLLVLSRVRSSLSSSARTSLAPSLRWRSLRRTLARRRHSIECRVESLDALDRALQADGRTTSGVQ
jgi:hypothetical protein